MPSCRGSSVARLLLAAGPRKIPGKHLGTLASASASFTSLDVRCRQSVRPLEILLSRRLRCQVHQQPSPPHRFCPSRPNTLARGCPMGPARALLRRACCRRRTSAAATSQPPRPHRLHWACLSSVPTRTPAAPVLSPTMEARSLTFDLATNASKLPMVWSTGRPTLGTCQWLPKTLQAVTADWFSATCDWSLGSSSRFYPCDSSGESSASTLASPTSMRWS